MPEDKYDTIEKRLAIVREDARRAQRAADALEFNTVEERDAHIEAGRKAYMDVMRKATPAAIEVAPGGYTGVDLVDRWRDEDIPAGNVSSAKKPAPPVPAVPDGRTGPTASLTTSASPRYPTRRFNVYGGMDASGSGPSGFQLSSVLIEDAQSGRRQAYAVGDELPDGSMIQDIQRGRGGEMRVSVVLPDGREEWIGRAPATTPDTSGL